MPQNFPIDNQYKEFIANLKSKILSSSQKLVHTVNNELINLYLKTGEDISNRQEISKWGDNFIGQVEHDLKLEFPDLKGFSKRNLIYMRSFYVFCKNFEITQQLVAQININFQLIYRLISQKYI